MATFPASYSSRDILPPQEGSNNVGRDGYQECELFRTHPKNKKRAKWYCRYVVPVITAPGKTKRIERRKYFGLCIDTPEREAKLKRDEFRKQVNAPVQQKLESQVPMSGWLTDYETTFIPSLKPNSQRVYSQVCGMIRDRFGALRMCDVTRESVQGWLNELSVSRGRSRLSVIQAVLRSVFEVAVDYGRYDQRNPVDRVRLPQGKQTDVDLRALSPEEIRRLLSVCDCCEIEGVRLGDVVRVALFCGLRVGEILALEWRDVVGPELHVRRNRAQYSADTTAPKSRSGKRIVPLGPVVLVKPDSAGAGDRIFPLEYRHVYRALRGAFDAAGITLQGTACHALRRAYATYMDAAGARGHLRQAMGHSSDLQTGQYVRRGFADQERGALWMAEQVIGEGRKQ